MLKSAEELKNHHHDLLPPIRSCGELVHCVNPSGMIQFVTQCEIQCVTQCEIEPVSLENQ